MVYEINKAHPRCFINGETRPIPLCSSIGKLSKKRERKKIYHTDQLGIGVSLYL